MDRNSPAMKAGVKTQDILLEINDKPINVRFPEEVAPARKVIADLPIGKEVELSIKRGPEMLTLKAKTQKLEGAVGEERELKTWGLSVRDVTARMRTSSSLMMTPAWWSPRSIPGIPRRKRNFNPAM